MARRSAAKKGSREKTRTTKTKGKRLIGAADPDKPGPSVDYGRLVRSRFRGKPLIAVLPYCEFYGGSDEIYWVGSTEVVGVLNPDYSVQVCPATNEFFHRIDIKSLVAKVAKGKQPPMPRRRMPDKVRRFLREEVREENDSEPRKDVKKSGKQARLKLR